MRIPGMGGKVMSRLGANVQVIAGGKSIQRLKHDAIDATEWVGPYDDEKLGFYKVAKNYYYPGWWEPGPSLSFYVNKKAWEGLPSSYQAAFQQAALASNLTMQNRYDAQNPPALKRLLSQGCSSDLSPSTSWTQPSVRAWRCWRKRRKRTQAIAPFTSTGRLTARRPSTGLAKRSLPTLRRPSVRPSPSPSPGLGERRSAPAPPPE